MLLKRLFDRSKNGISGEVADRREAEESPGSGETSVDGFTPEVRGALELGPLGEDPGDGVAAPVGSELPPAAEELPQLAGLCGSLHACLDLGKDADEGLSFSLTAVVETFGLMDQMKEGADRILATVGGDDADVGLGAALATARERVKHAASVLEQGRQRLTEFEGNLDSLLDINATIEDFADRGNIVALNASIESARAGEAGRAFSVIAKEMRSLAGKSADLTKRSEAVVGNVREGLLRMQEDLGNAIEASTQALQWMETQAGDSLRLVAEAAREIDHLADEQVESGESMAEKLSSVRRALGNLDEAIGGICQTLNPVTEEKDNG